MYNYVKVVIRVLYLSIIWLPRVTLNLHSRFNTWKRNLGKKYLFRLDMTIHILYWYILYISMYMIIVIYDEIVTSHTNSEWCYKWYYRDYSHIVIWNYKKAKRMKFIQLKLYVRQTKNDRSIYLYQIYMYRAKKVSSPFWIRSKISYDVFNVWIIEKNQGMLFMFCYIPFISFID